MTTQPNDTKEFLNYCNKARQEFCESVNNAEAISGYLMTAIDSLLICFDQMKERIATSNQSSIPLDRWSQGMDNSLTKAKNSKLT